MNVARGPWQLWAAGGLLLALLVNRASGGAIVREATAGVAASAVGAVGDVGAGVIFGIGDAVGVPRTDSSQCDRDLEAGRWWDASFSCPAGRYTGAAWQSIFGG